MKKLILTLISFLVLSAVSAQYYYVPYTKAGKNPGGVNTEGENPASLLTGWSSIWTGPSSSAVAYSATQTIPFAFNFNGSAVTSLKACNAGFITFDVASTTIPTSFSNLSLPSAFIPDKSVCVLGMNPNSNTTYPSNIVTKTFGTAPNRQYWIQFNFFAEANVQSGWTYWSIVLEEGSNKIHIVDMKTLCVTSAGQLCTSNVKMSAGIQIDAADAYTIAGSPSLGAQSITENLFSSADNSYYTFAQGSQPAYNAEGWNTAVPDFLALTQAPFVVKGIFRNIGTSAITTCNFNYSINNGPAVSTPVTVNIAQNANATVSTTSNWTPSAVGVYKVTAWLSNINGNPDGEGANDSVKKTVTVLADFVQRVALHEVFTSSTCGPCVAGNRNTDENIFPKYDPSQYAVIKYQMSWPGTGDPYTTAEGNVRRTLYAVNSIPNMQVDGAWNSNASSYTTALFDQFSNKPAYIKIQATHTINFKKVIVDVKVTPLSDFNNPNMKVFVAILEKKTVKNVKSNGETEFHHVLKKMLPDASGTALGAVTKGTSKVFPTMTYIVPGVVRLPLDGQTANIINLATENSFEELQDCEVVVFIQDLATKEVFQAANSVGTILSVDDVNNETSGISVYPNPSVAGSTNLSFNLNSTEQVKVNVYNTLGQVVLSIDANDLVQGVNSITLNTESFAKGVYTVKIEGNGFSSMEKFIIQ